MSDQFKDKIRDRMDQSSFSAQSELVFPVDNYNLNKTPAENFVRFGRPIIYEMIGLTAKEEAEQGAVVWVPASTIDPKVTEAHVSKIVKGTESSVASQSVQPDAPIFFDLHTHPIDSTAMFSRADIQSMMGSIIQYPDTARQTLRENPTRRSFGVIAQPFGYDKTQVLVKLVTATGGVLKLDIEQQTELTKEVLSAWDDRDQFKPLEGFFSRFGDFFTLSSEQVTLPTPSRIASYRKAIPDSIPDREFGQAFAKGDLRDVLRGVEYV